MNKNKYEIAKRKAEILVEALPYIKRFQKKIIVIKYGGSSIINDNLKNNIFKDIVFMKLVGMKPVIVHGGGPEITAELEKIGKKTYFVDGLRYTDKKVMKIVEKVLLKKINKKLVLGINQNGGNALGLSGKDDNMILAEKLYSITKNKKGEKKEVDIGYVGKIKKINPEIILDTIYKNYIPVISPIGIDKKKETYNINADFMASEIASILKADKLLLLTNIEGIYLNKNNKDFILKNLKINEIKKLIKNKIIIEGMIPKVNCCINALKKGVRKVHIINGTVPHSILLEIFTDEGIGTMIVK